MEKTVISNSTDFDIEFEPLPISRDEDLRRKQEEFEKIPEMPDIIKAEAQMQGGETYEFKMDSKNPFTVEALWKIADWQFLDVNTSFWINDSRSKYLNDIQKGLAQDKLRKILAVEFDKIYEIFFNYTLFHVQKADKKESIAITWQDLLFILKFVSKIRQELALNIWLSTKYCQAAQWSIRLWTYMIQKEPEFQLLR